MILRWLLIRILQKTFSFLSIFQFIPWVFVVVDILLRYLSFLILFFGHHRLYVPETVI